MSHGVDYAWGRPGGAALRAAGFSFACRYLSNDPSKDLSKTEAADLAAHGVSSVVVWETTSTRPLAGRAAGVADAQSAAAQAAQCGMPTGRPIYFAVDFNPSASQLVTVRQYISGVASVLGEARTGVYGGYAAVTGCKDLARWFWQTAAWSSGRWFAAADIRQTGSTVEVNRITCDHDESTRDDFGQWTPGHPPTFTSSAPTVHLAHVISAAQHDPRGKQGATTYPADVKPVEAALVAEGLLSTEWAKDGSFGSRTVTAYSAWQRHCGYTGAAANGIPGHASLVLLGGRHGFKVV